MENASSKRSVCCLITTQRSPKYKQKRPMRSKGFVHRGITQSLYTRNIHSGETTKKSSLLEEVVEEAEREDLQRKLGPELSFRL